MQREGASLPTQRFGSLTRQEKLDRDGDLQQANEKAAWNQVVDGVGDGTAFFVSLITSSYPRLLKIVRSPLLLGYRTATNATSGHHSTGMNFHIVPVARRATMCGPPLKGSLRSAFASPTFPSSTFFDSSMYIVVRK